MLTGTCTGRSSHLLLDTCLAKPQWMWPGRRKKQIPRLRPGVILFCPIPFQKGIITRGKNTYQKRRIREGARMENLGVILILLSMLGFLLGVVGLIKGNLRLLRIAT